MGRFFIGKIVTWKKEERKIIGIEKGEKIKKPIYQNGVLFTGFESKAKRYVLDNGDKVTGQQLINYLQSLKRNEKRKNESQKKGSGYDFNRPFWAQDLGDEWDDYAWGADDF